MGKFRISFLYPDDDPDHSQYLVGSKLDQDQSSEDFPGRSTSSICVILLTNKHGHGKIVSLVEVIISCNNPYDFVIREICLKHDYEQ